ncbi:NnrS family protein [Wenzhouxiangella marina]|uniref:NnrS protein superfamily n=1 Tax=Wenzhouxiangella marina TaxID=1579979 RepID=A0A0K0XZ19_9GAMM|nr:NnrS family protein [Wenzhouxiangella marina]AKS42934.1 NnrS protein superfamily [Wenzhouxiangella marina]MBB6087382.1 uncharacterized protein involved in response to NO [Wenzhouxiangella marina]
MNPQPFRTLFAYPFRIFFLAAAGYAIVALPAWLTVIIGGLPLNGSIPALNWHAHEMLFGFTGAAIAGFLLTAMCNWTGAAPLEGRRLMLLFLCWLAGRMAMWLSSALPEAVVALIDLSFPAIVTVYAGRIIIAAGSRRNLVLVAVLAVFCLCNAGFHLGLLTDRIGLVIASERAALLLVVILITVIGGRITPAFSRNWLQRQARSSHSVRAWAWLDRSTIGSLLALVIALFAFGSSPLTGALACAAALFQSARLLAWSGWSTAREPLLWILHLGQVFIPLGLGLMAAAMLGLAIPATAWAHALGTAVAIMILGVMTRVALGHTGRPLTLPTGGVALYAAAIAAMLLRLAVALGWLPWRGGLLVSGLLWMLAFLGFVLIYWPILSRPRVDGRLG